MVDQSLYISSMTSFMGLKDSCFRRIELIHAKRIRVRRFQLVDKPEQHAAHGVARGPSLELGRHIFTGHRFAIVKSQTAAQFKRPDFAVLAGAVVLHHLRLDFSFGILGK